MHVFSLFHYELVDAASRLNKKILNNSFNYDNTGINKDNGIHLLFPTLSTNSSNVTCKIPVCCLEIFCNMYFHCFGFGVTTLSDINNSYVNRIMRLEVLHFSVYS